LNLTFGFRTRSTESDHDVVKGPNRRLGSEQAGSGKPGKSGSLSSMRMRWRKDYAPEE